MHINKTRQKLANLKTCKTKYEFIHEHERTHELISKGASYRHMPKFRYVLVPQIIHVPCRTVGISEAFDGLNTNLLYVRILKYLYLSSFILCHTAKNTIMNLTFRRLNCSRIHRCTEYKR
jgi:hypothetical protein